MKTAKNNNDSPKKLTKAEMVKKMLHDQKYIRDAIQNGVGFDELEKQGFKFARLQPIHN